jgi:hypothetical protein
VSGGGSEVGEVGEVEVAGQEVVETALPVRFLGASE